MKELWIDLSSVEKVKEFVETVGPLEGDYTLVQDKYMLDAKSLMGIFSLDISHPIKLIVKGNEDTAPLSPFLAK